MRYKGTFRPTYVLDPESYDWNLLDRDMFARLDKRKYVSLSRDKRLEIGPADEDLEQETDDQSHEAHPSVFDADMPGVLTKAQVHDVDLADIKVALGQDVFSLAV
jgi:arginine-tRNA-protein transferase